MRRVVVMSLVAAVSLFIQAANGAAPLQNTPTIEANGNSLHFAAGGDITLSTNFKEVTVAAIIEGLASIADIATSVQEGDAALQAKVNAVTTNLQAYTSKESFSEVTGRLDNVDTAIDSLGERIDDVAATVAVATDGMAADLLNASQAAAVSHSEMLEFTAAVQVRHGSAACACVCVCVRGVCVWGGGGGGAKIRMGN
jgi:hypothetical protein